MPNPNVTINPPAFVGNVGSFAGTVDFQGATGTVAYAIEPQPSGTASVPAAMTSVTGNNFVKSALVLGAGRYRIRVTATPTSGDGVPVNAYSSVFSVNRAAVRAIMPAVGGAVATSPDPSAVMLGATLRAGYSAAVAGAAVGGKRSAGGQYISQQMLSKQLLRIYRGNTLVVRAEYTGGMSADFDVGISVKTGILQPTAVLATADINSGKWRFVLGGGPLYSREISGTVGPVGSGKNIIMSSSPQAGNPFASMYSFVLPPVMDL